MGFANTPELSLSLWMSDSSFAIRRSRVLAMVGGVRGRVSDRWRLWFGYKWLRLRCRGGG
jgi:hypothetical protein